MERALAPPGTREILGQLRWIANHRNDTRYRRGNWERFMREAKEQLRQGTSSENSKALKEVIGVFAQLHPHGILHSVKARRVFQDQTCFNLARFFCTRVRDLLKQQQGGEAQLSLQNPLTVATKTMQPQDTDNPEQEVVWNTRLRAYLAWCVDGGMFPVQLSRDSENSLPLALGRDNELNLRKVVMRLQKNDYGSTERDPYLDELMDFLLHLRPRVLPKGGMAAQQIHSRPYEQPAILYKLADPDLMNSFVCNEEVMAILLQSGYFENLRDRHQKISRLAAIHIAYFEKNKDNKRADSKQGAVLTSKELQKGGPPEVRVFQFVMEALVIGILKNCSHNLDLVRLACIKSEQLQMKSEALVPYLWSICQTGHNAVYGFRALAQLCKPPYSCVTKVEEAGVFHEACRILQFAKSNALLEACVTLILHAIPADMRNQKHRVPTKLLTDKKITNFLMNLLKRRPLLLQGENSWKGVRYTNNLLATTCQVLAKLSGSRKLLKEMLDKNCHVELGSLLDPQEENENGVRQPNPYRSILAQVIRTLGRMYINAKICIPQWYLQPENSTIALEHARRLVILLKESAPVQLVLQKDILITLKVLLRPMDSKSILIERRSDPDIPQKVRQLRLAQYQKLRSIERELHLRDAAKMCKEKAEKAAKDKTKDIGDPLRDEKEKAALESERAVAEAVRQAAEWIEKGILEVQKQTNDFDELEPKKVVAKVGEGQSEVQEADIARGGLWVSFEA
eukprot:g74800.t1